jgi:hypothetical protein
VKLYIDKDSNRFISNPTFKSSIDSVSFKRGDSATVELIFVSNNTSLSAVSGLDVTLGIKESGRWDGPYIVIANEYTINGDSYVLKPNFNTDELNALLNHGDSDDTNDIPSVTLMMEVTWSENGNDFYSTNTISAIVENDVNKLTEATPTPSQSLTQWLTNGVISFEPPFYYTIKATNSNYTTYFGITANEAGVVGNSLQLSTSAFDALSGTSFAYVSGNQTVYVYPEHKYLQVQYNTVNDLLVVNGYYNGRPSYDSLIFSGGTFTFADDELSEKWIYDSPNFPGGEAYAELEGEPYNAIYPYYYDDGGSTYSAPGGIYIAEMVSVVNALSSGLITMEDRSGAEPSLTFIPTITMAGGSNDNPYIAPFPPCLHIYDNKLWVPADTTPTGWRPLALSAALP